MSASTEHGASPGQAQGRSSLFESRIARKILALFVLSALLPLLLFAAISLHQVTEQLEEQARNRLHETCKAVGMTMVERLHLLRADLVLANDASSRDREYGLMSRFQLNDRMGVRFDWIAVATLDGELLEVTEAGVRLPVLNATEREHLLESGTLLLYGRSPETGLLSAVLAVLPTSDRSRDRVMFGQIRPGFLWGGEWTQQSHTEFVTLTEDGERLLFATDAESGFREQVRRAAAVEPSSGQFAWTEGDDSHLASYRTMFIRPMFYNSFVVGLSQPRGYVLQPVATFKSLFLLFGLLTLFAVIAASLVQIRRSLSPIVLLSEGTRRLATNSSDEEVVIRSGDEFEDLARSFNKMAAGIRIRTQELERANRAKSDFLAHMSHELRTPLSAVLGYAQISLQPESTEAERVGNLEIIRDNGAHLIDVVDTILEMSRLSAGAFAPAFGPCRPREVVGEAIAWVKGLAVEKGLDLVVEEEAAIPETIRSDATRLRQILINVVGNAIKFTDRGLVRVQTAWESADAPRQRRLVIRVQDTGPGIPAHQIAEIFEPFQQTDLSMSRRHGGTGLGLSLARGFARALGGDVTCQSHLGVGSTFAIEVDPGELEVAPAALAACDETEAAAPASAPHARPREARGLRILVAEDVAVNRKMAVIMLKRAGHVVEEAENGRIAYEKASAAAQGGRCFDAILMDMQMPEMDGYEATRCLRATGYSSPIIALTAHALEGDRERCLEAGCDDYTTKPFDREQLLGVIQRNVVAA